MKLADAYDSEPEHLLGTDPTAAVANGPVTLLNLD